MEKKSRSWALVNYEEFNEQERHFNEVKEVNQSTISKKEKEY